MKVFLVAWCKLTARHVQGTIFCFAIGRSKRLLTLEITVSLFVRTYEKSTGKIRTKTVTSSDASLLSY
jgi:hypothetical protein